jgi:3-isopropylmalate/(R)-2-methylmalate dehydratase small subunit
MESKSYSGRIWVMGDQIDTDQIVPSRVLTEADPQKMASAAFELVIPNFAKQVQKGDIIIAGKNFGCGSSREEAVFVLKLLGVRAIVARSFARIFYRNMINLGLLPIICPDLTVSSLGCSNMGLNGEKIVVDLHHNVIINQNSKISMNIELIPLQILNILNAGGVIELIKKINPSN